MDSLAGAPLSLSFLSDYRSARHRGSPQSASKKQVDLGPQPRKMDLLTVPVVDTQMEARPMTLEEMEDVGKRYRERKRQHKVPGPTGRAWGSAPGQAGVRVHCTFGPGTSWEQASSSDDENAYLTRFL